MGQITIDMKSLYNEVAKLSELDEYIHQVLKKDVDGNEVVLTGQAPIWLYLKIAHALHGKARKLIYNSPVTGNVIIFNHSPY